jgi:hypothetical protein
MLLRCMAGLLWAVADCCLLFYWLVAGSKVITAHTRLVLSSKFKSIPANRRCLLQRQPKPNQVQIHSRGIIWLRRQHSWELGHSSMSSNCCWGHIPLAHSHLVASVGSIVSYCWCFSFVHSIHSHRCCFFLLSLDQSVAAGICSLVVVCALSTDGLLFAYLSRCSTCHGLMVFSCSLVVPHQTVFFNSNSLLRSIGRSAASSYRRGTQPFVSFGVPRTPTTSHCGLGIAPLCAVGLMNMNPLL